MYHRRRDRDRDGRACRLFVGCGRSLVRRRRRLCLGPVGMDLERAQPFEPFDQPEHRFDLVGMKLACSDGPVQPAPSLGRIHREQFVENLLTPLFAV
jgi:hypothetical protein